MSPELALYAALTYMPRYDRDGWWSQARGGFESSEFTRAATIGVGVDTGVWSWRLAYTSAYSQAVAYTKDDANYDPQSQNGCAGECLPTTYGVTRQTSIVLSVDRKWYWKDFYIYAGGALIRQDWRHAREFSDSDPYGKTFDEHYRTVDYNIAARGGVSYRWFLIEYMVDSLSVDHDGVCCPPVRESLSFGMRAPL